MRIEIIEEKKASSNGERIDKGDGYSHSSTNELKEIVQYLDSNGSQQRRGKADKEIFQPLTFDSDEIEPLQSGQQEQFSFHGTKAI